MKTAHRKEETRKPSARPLRVTTPPADLPMAPRAPSIHLPLLPNPLLLPSTRTFLRCEAFFPCDPGVLHYDRVHDVTVCANPALFAEFGTTPWPLTLIWYCDATVERL